MSVFKSGSFLPHFIGLFLLSFLGEMTFFGVRSWAAPGLTRTPNDVSCRGALASASVRILTLAEVSGKERQIAALQAAIRLAGDLYENAERTGREGIFPIDPRALLHWIQIDQQTRFIRFAFGPQDQLIGFAIAHPDSAGVVELEKFGVTEDAQGLGVGRQLLHSLARRAQETHHHTIQLLVRKGNSQAIGIYEHFGFVNVTPEYARRDPRYNAFQFAVPTDSLLEKTRK